MSLVTSLEAIKRIDTDLFAIEIEEVEIIFTLPSFKRADQYAKFLSLAADDEMLKEIIYEHIFITCVEDKFLANHEDDIPAGIPHTIGRLILLMSGTDENIIEYTNGLLDLYRQDVNSPINVIKSRICMIFNAYTFKDLNNLNYQELMYIYIQAEQQMLHRGIMKEGNELRLVPIEEKKQQVFGIEKAIMQDALEYKQFEQQEPNQNLRDDPEYQAKMKKYEERYKRIKNGG